MNIQELKQRVLKLLEKIIGGLERKLDSEAKITDIKNYIYIIEKILILTEKYCLIKNGIEKVDHDIIMNFIQRYLESNKSK